jgi:hypothetical protein
MGLRTLVPGRLRTPGARARRWSTAALATVAVGGLALGFAAGRGTGLPTAAEALEPQKADSIQRTLALFERLNADLAAALADVGEVNGGSLGLRLSVLGTDFQNAQAELSGAFPDLFGKSFFFWCSRFARAEALRQFGTRLIVRSNVPYLNMEFFTLGNDEIAEEIQQVKTAKEEMEACLGDALAADQPYLGGIPDTTPPVLPTPASTPLPLCGESAPACGGLCPDGALCKPSVGGACGCEIACGGLAEAECLGACPDGTTCGVVTAPLSDVLPFLGSGDFDDEDTIDVCACVKSATTPPSTGRAVVLLEQTGSLSPGSRLCLDDVGGGCVAGPDVCADDHLHGEITVEGETGTFPDPLPGACGHGSIVESEPGCGPDAVPDCAP